MSQVAGGEAILKKNVCFFPFFGEKVQNVDKKSLNV